MFLTLEKFLEYFTPLDITKEEFSQRFTVKYKKPLTFRDIFTVPNKIIKTTSDQRYLNRDRIIEYFYEIIVRNRYKYLELFWYSYFDFKDPETLKWSGVSLTKEGHPEFISTQRNDASRRVIRNLFHLELLDQTIITNSVKSKVSFWRGLVNMYNKLELEDRLFAPSSIGLFLRAKTSGTGINYHNLFYLYQAYQPKASIFNPYSIKYIFDLVTSDMASSNLKLFSPVLSWASYMLAFIYSPQFRYYLGVDVMPSVCEKTKFLADHFIKDTERSAEIVCCPSEQLAIRYVDQMLELQNFFDVAIVCPPYYDMEIYAEGEQSINSWKTYSEWLNGYWYGTVQIMFHLIKSGGRIALIANDYQTLKGETYDLTGDLTGIMNRYFHLEHTYLLHNRTSPLRTNKKDRTERLYIYLKE